MACVPFGMRYGARLMATAGTGMRFATALDETSQIGMEMHVFGTQQVLKDRVNSLIDENERAARRLGFRRGLVPIAYSTLAYCALVGALGLGAVIDPADFGAVGAVMLVMLRSLTYGQALQGQLSAINSTMPFVDALSDEVERYKRATCRDGGMPVGHVGPLALEAAGYEYTDGVPVLRDVELTISANEVVGIVGPSGSGKSTLVQLLLGLREPSTGRALAGGRPLQTLSREEWTRKVTHVPQQPQLIAGTVADNIRFMREGIDGADVERAARMAHVHDEIMQLAGGYDAQVGERGSRLSGGQRQRLILARALAGDPDVLILDEPTSALDVRSESLIRQTLEGLRGTTTVVIIAHRLSTLDICDRIMVIQDGELVGFDSPIALEESNEFYRESLRLSGMRS